MQRLLLLQHYMQDWTEEKNRIWGHVKKCGKSVTRKTKTD